MTTNCGLDRGLTRSNLYVKMRRSMLWLLVIADLAALPVLAKAQSLADPIDSSGTVASTTPAQLTLPYTRPTHTTKFRNYVFDVIGPSPVDRKSTRLNS